MCKEDDKRKTATFLLNGKTLKLLKEYSYEKFGETNMSRAIMSMATEYEKHKAQQSTQ